MFLEKSTHILSRSATIKLYPEMIDSEHENLHKN